MIYIETHPLWQTSSGNSGHLLKPRRFFSGMSGGFLDQRAFDRCLVKSLSGCVLSGVSMWMAPATNSMLQWPRYGLDGSVFHLPI